MLSTGDKAIEAAEEKQESTPSIALLSPVKENALKRMQTRRVIWIGVEIVFFIVLLALLILHSFRLRNKANDNTYARWSSSWVMILLSVLMVVIALAVVITFYYFRTALSWILDSKTTDQDILNPSSRNGVRRVGIKFFRTNNEQQWQSPPPPPTRYSDTGCGPNNGDTRMMPRNLLYGVQHDPALMRRPWLSVEGRNSRAWRQMRARERSSSLSSSTTSPVSSDSYRRDPRRPPRAARKWQSRRSGPRSGRQSTRRQSSLSD
ncbi:hypothetical protein IW140_000308 [Coemansia sp. RSA 1813]|nr:hypothetical protein EV178_000508 [Coemansia sp. RSA 1646]KAJ1773724.1 hypothetical protein LPJ74_000267 [Coemansia sp. RSA 1843]KAJ2093685.1 hypothetical protein IW138_000080 [Coemansia sp. RSA 986]KAJ2217898.1 hypothetical protein EV179_000042 [Coemansia sp. RSA 487]KAJ2573264.1 hypothetical protein IW140_000308 [Coemansia sp. RSA 1813]